MGERGSLGPLPILHQDRPALPAMPPRLTALYGQDGGVVLLVGEICAPEKAEPAIFQCDASNLLRYLHLKEPSWEKGGRNSGWAWDRRS